MSCGRTSEPAVHPIVPPTPRRAFNILRKNKGAPESPDLADGSRETRFGGGAAAGVGFDAEVDLRGGAAGVGEGAADGSPDLGHGAFGFHQAFSDAQPPRQ